MKKIVLFTILLLSFTACEKEKEDQREKFIGTFQAEQIVSIPSLQISDVSRATCTIIKGSTANQIIFINSDGSRPTANVNGNTYITDKFTITENINGTTVTTEIIGNGVINGNIINESGIYRILMLGSEYNGTYSCTYRK